jgi:hypothetical protein
MKGYFLSQTKDDKPRFSRAEVEVALGGQDLVETPHGGLLPFHQKSSRLQTVNLRALCGANLVTCPADFRGPETIADHRVVGPTLSHLIRPLS